MGFSRTLRRIRVEHGGYCAAEYPEIEESVSRRVHGGGEREPGGIQGEEEGTGAEQVLREGGEDVRLGDLDALYEKVADHVTSVSVCATAQQAIGQTDFKWRCLEDIHNAPTIDAIPVEWMEKMLEKMNHAAEPHFAFFYVLNEWQNTKSIEEQQAESEMRDWQKEQEENGE